VISPMTVIKVSRRIAQNTLCDRCRSVQFAQAALSNERGEESIKFGEIHALLPLQPLGNSFLSKAVLISSNI
jgi:hypothetical protein